MVLSSRLGFTRSRQLLFWGIILSLCVVLIISRALFLKLLSLIAVGLFAVSILVTLVTFRRAKSVSAAGVWVSMVMSACCLAGYALFLGAGISGGMALAMLLAGGVIGVGWSLTAKLFIESSIVRYRGNAGQLLMWALVFFLNQLLAIATNRTPQIMFALLFMTTGLVLGGNTCLLLRARLVKERAGEE